jgi:MOSC N-terminal beta barrel domain
MLGESLEAVDIGPGGCAGDRRWIVVDADSGRRIANKRGPTDPRLRACRAELLDGRSLRITLSGGERVEGGDVEGALSGLLERRVRLERCETPALARIGATGAPRRRARPPLTETEELLTAVPQLLRAIELVLKARLEVEDRNGLRRQPNNPAVLARPADHDMGGPGLEPGTSCL